MLMSFCIGAGAMYLYIHPGDVDGMKQTGLNALNTGAKIVVEATDD
jgi:hypothetical protein